MELLRSLKIERNIFAKNFHPVEILHDFWSQVDVCFGQRLMCVLQVEVCFGHRLMCVLWNFDQNSWKIIKFHQKSSKFNEKSCKFSTGWQFFSKFWCRDYLHVAIFKRSNFKTYCSRGASDFGGCGGSFAGNLFFVLQFVFEWSSRIKWRHWIRWCANEKSGRHQRWYCRCGWSVKIYI